MAKIYKVEFYFTDMNDEFENGEHFKGEFKELCYDLDGMTDLINIKESEEFEWDDDLLINKTDAAKEDYEVYFRNKKLVLNKEVWRLGFKEAVFQMADENIELKEENEHLKKELSLLCPIGDLSIIESLKYEKLMLMEQIEELKIENDWLNGKLDIIYEVLNEKKIK